jgi:hypothetical protein
MIEREDKERKGGRKRESETTRRKRCENAKRDDQDMHKN